MKNSGAILREDRDEQVISLASKNITLVASSRGSILREIVAKGQRITRDIPDGVTVRGEKGALFCCPQLFARFPDRVLRFAGQEFQLSYPDEIDGDHVDPQNIFIHGFEHYYDWDVLCKNESSVTFTLGANRFPASFPFPHTSFVEYQLDGDSDLIIRVGIKECLQPTPAMLTIHPFFKYLLPEISQPPQFEATLLSKFSYPANSETPMATEAPIGLPLGGPFSVLQPLPKDLDHSFLSTGSSKIRWPNGIELIMSDETDEKICPVKPLQIWTTGADSRNAFGIEQGGPANLFNLVANKKVPCEWLPVCQPGQVIERVVRYTVN